MSETNNSAVVETAKKDFAELAEGRAEGLKGLALAVKLGLAGLAVVAGVKEDDLPLWQFAGIWGGAYVAYRIGARLDTWFFDPLYGAKARAKKSGWFRRWAWLLDWLPGAALMHESREAAREKLGAEHQAHLYATAEKIFGPTKAWNEEVEPWIQLSKAARTVFVPALLAAFYDRWIFRAPPSPIPPKSFHGYVVALLQYWPFCAMIAGVSLFCYLVFRIRHMNALYRLVAESTVSVFPVRTLTGTHVALVRVGQVVIPREELPIFNPFARLTRAARKIVRDTLETKVTGEIRATEKLKLIFEELGFKGEDAVRMDWLKQQAEEHHFRYDKPTHDGSDGRADPPAGPAQHPSRPEAPTPTAGSKERSRREAKPTEAERR